GTREKFMTRAVRLAGQIAGQTELPLQNSDYQRGFGEAEGAGALCSCCAGCGEAAAPCASAFGGFGAPGGGTVPGAAPVTGSPADRVVGGGGLVCAPASSARSFSQAW